MARKPIKKIFAGHYEYTIGDIVYEFDRMLRSDTGERTHWNIRIKGGQYFDGAQTLEECIQVAEMTSVGMAVLAIEESGQTIEEIECDPRIPHPELN